MKLSTLLTLATLGALTAPVFAGPLKEAKINQIINDVKVIEPRTGARPAILQDTIKDERGVATGIQSRAELVFQDNTLTRLGAETFFSFQPGTRNVTLDRGTMLLQVPKNLGGAHIRAASVSASITGTTIMMEKLPGKQVKIVVLEGSLRVGLDARPGESVLLTAGRMVLVSPDAKELPKPVNADLRKLVRTSALIDPALFNSKSKVAVASLPSMALIEEEILRQDILAKEGTLVEASIEIPTADPTEIALLGRKTVTTDAKSEASAAIATSIADATNADPTPSVSTSGTGTGPGPGPVMVVAPPTTPAVGTITPLFPALDPAATVPTGGTAIIPVHTLPINGNNKLNNNTVTTGGATPNAGGKPGAIYAGPSVDGLASEFIFGGTTLQDAQVNFDNRFGVNLESAFPTAGVAVFRFNALQLEHVIDFDTAGGPLDVALIGDTKIENVGPNMTMDASGLRSLFLGTLDGSISLDDKVTISASAASGYRFTHLYGRGATGNVTLGAPINTPGADLFVEAGNNAVFTATSSVSVNRAVINAGNNTQFFGSFTGNQVQVWSGGLTTISGTVNAGEFYGLGNSLTVNGSLTANRIVMDLSGSLITVGAGFTINAPDVVIKTGGPLTLNAARINLTGATNFRAHAPTINVASHLALPSGATGVLEAGSGGINSATYDLTGFTRVAVDGGNATVGNLDSKYIDVAGGNLTVSGNLTTDNAVTTGNMNVTGTISPRVGDAVTSLRVLDAGSLSAGGGLNFRGADGSAPGAGYQLAIVSPSSVVFDASAINGANLDGGDAAPAGLAEGGNGGALHVGTDARPIGGDVTINTPISATTGANANGVATGGKGGTVNVTASGSINVNASVKVSDSAAGRASKQGGNIRLESRKTTGSAINVTSSGQLLSLLAAAAPGPGGKVEFVSAGGDITVNGGKIQADKGTVDIRNNGPSGLVQLTNATISGDVVKVGALGANGQLLVGGGSINADTMLKLYGGTSNGEVRFTDNTTLGGNGVKHIAGKTVSIDNGKVVTVGGNSAANVYTDNANYTGSGGNGSKTGSFGGKGATTQGFAGRPSF